MLDVTLKLYGNAFSIMHVLYNNFIIVDLKLSTYIEASKYKKQN